VILLSFTSKWARPVLFSALAGCGAVPGLAAVTDDDEPPVGATIVVTGAEQALEANIRAVLAVRNEPCSTSQLRLRRLLPQIRNQIADAATALGYYHAESEVRFSEGINCWRLDIDVTQGERVLLGDVDILIEAEPQNRALFADLLEGAPLLPGQPLHHGTYEAYKSTLSARAVEQGFFAARFSRAEIAVDLDANRADIGLTFDPGPQYLFGPITIIKDDSLNDSLIRGMLTVQQGEPYSSTALAEMRQNLGESQYFRQIRVSPQIGAATQQAVPVELQLDMRPRHAWTGGLGFTTDTGPRARLSYENRYVNARGHRLLADSSLSAVRSQIDGNYVIPLADAARQSLNFAAGYSDEDNESFESKRSKLEASIRNQNRAGWLQTVFVDLQNDDYIVAEDRDTSVLSTLGVSLSRTKADNLINPNKGWKLFTQLRGASEAVLSDSTFVQFYGSAKHVYGFNRSRLLTRVELGATWIDAAEELPASLRYFAGGDQSIRGYKFRALGPTNADGEIIGGKQLVVASLEYDFEVRANWRVAAFVDTGNAFNSRNDFEWQQSAGIGLRWMSPIGPVRVDVAHPIDGDEGVRFHVTMGPDL
jgi:translocation and assembly module TamA